MSFAWAPGPYVAVLVAALVVAWTVFERRRQRRVLARAELTIDRDTPLARMLASVSWIRLHTARTLWAVALGLAVLAASGPRVPGEDTSETRGIDVVLVLDYSTSMLANDVYPDRLTASKRAVEDILDNSVHNRVGVVVFGGAAAHFPLTHDRQAVRTMFRGLEVSDLPPGSNLGEAIRVARCLARPERLDDPGCGGVGGRGRGGAPLDDKKAPQEPAATTPGVERARALVILTDGEVTDGDAGAELTLATRLGIEVYLVGVGTIAGARVPELDPRGLRLGWKRHPDGTDVESTLQLGKLRAFADIAGGDRRLFAIGFEGRPLDSLQPALDTLQRGFLRTQLVRRHRDINEWFLFPAFMLLIVEATMSTRRRRVAELR